MLIQFIKFTGMVGYPENLTDPSYKGQILCLTYPLVTLTLTLTLNPTLILTLAPSLTLTRNPNPQS